MTNAPHKDRLAQAYDELPYMSNVFSHCQPSRLYTLAKMRGLDPQPLENAKILEIGCSSGGNLIPNAIRYPNSLAVGIDLSESQINLGKQLLQQVGIKNIELVVADISHVSFNVKFDYIICHGVFSWIPKQTRQDILRTIQNYLSPNGIAFISYNTYPGWKMKEMARDLMLLGSHSELPRKERVDESFKLLSFVQNIINRKHAVSLKVKALTDEFKEIQSRPHYYVAHEYLAEINNPLYFIDFINEIEQYNLGYIIDSSKPIVRRKLTLDNGEYSQICRHFNYQVEYVEQFIDFLENRQFRTSLITHKSHLQERNVSNHVEQHSLCHHFYDLYINVRDIYYVEETENRAAHWVLDNDITIDSTPLNDKLCEYLKKIASQCKVCKVQDIFDLFSSLSEHDKKRLTDHVMAIVHLAYTNVSLFPHKFTPYGKKPNMSEKQRKLMHFVSANPNLTNLVDAYYRVVYLDFFTHHLAQYLDGTRTIVQLEKQIRRDFDRGYLTTLIDGKPSTTSEISNQEIKKMVKKALEILEGLGYFNHY